MQSIARRTKISNYQNVLQIARVVNSMPSRRTYYTSEPTIPQLMQASPGYYTVIKTMSKELGAQFSNGFKDLWRNYKKKKEIQNKFAAKEPLSREDISFMEKTSEDLKKLIPFGMFSMLPGSTVLLPVFIKLFPHLLPSTFHTPEVQEKNLEHLRGKYMLGRNKLYPFLQCELVAIEASGRGEEVFSEKAHHLRSRLKIETKEELDSSQLLFSTSLKLSNLDWRTLVALCNYLGLFGLLPTPMLVSKISNWAKKMSLDDWYLRKGGINSLSAEQVKSACIDRRLILKLRNNDEKSQRQALTKWLNTLPALALNDLRSTAPDYIKQQANEEQGSTNCLGDVDKYVWGAFLLDPNTSK